MLRPDQISGQFSAADHLLIDEEQARLEQFLSDLRDTCDNFGAQGNCYGCSRAQVATCQGRLASFFYDFLDLVAEHFENEEKILRISLMAESDDEIEDENFRQHLTDHARVMGEVRSLVRASALLSQQGNPSEAIRQLDRKIVEIFGMHVHAFDLPFLQATQGKDAGR